MDGGGFVSTIFLLGSMEEFKMENMFSFKDLEKVRIKATYNMKIGDREILEGERRQGSCR